MEKQSTCTKKGFDPASHYYVTRDLHRLESDTVYYTVERDGKDHVLRMYSKERKAVARTLFIGNRRMLESFLTGFLFGRDGNHEF